jgi:hypothetical protein
MTTKRKAELQRKLALAPVPKPPADLAERIKGEIPQHLMMDTGERARFRRAVAFNVRVAASIILLVSSVYLALHLLSRKFGPQETAATAVTASNAAKPIVLPNTPPPPISEEAKAEAQKKKPIIVAESRRETLDQPQAKTQGQPENRAAETADNVTVEEPAVVGAAPSAAASAPAPPPMMPMAAKAAPAFSLDVEASAAPFDAAKNVVRVSVDGAFGRASDVTPDVAFSDDAVASWHTLASDTTSLYEITLRPQTGAEDVIATVRVGGTERVIRRSDLHAWSDASRRMKATTLAAALDAGVPPKDVAAKARAAGLDDLAAAAEARARKQQ